MAEDSGPRRIPGGRAAAVIAATALTTVTMAMAPVRGSTAAAGVSDPCAIAPGVGLTEGPTPAKYIRPLGRGKAMMIMVDFPDIPAVSPLQARASFFADYGEKYVDRASYGRYQLEVDHTDSWIRMPRPWSSYDIERGSGHTAMRAYVQDAIDTARAQGTDFHASDFVYVVADDNVPAPPTVSQADIFDGLRAGDHIIRAAALVFGRGTDSATWQRGNFVHEANHLYGLPDLYNVQHGASVEFAGGWDTMSMAGISDLMGWHKWKLGWIPDQAVACAESGESVHWLTPIGAAEGANIAVVKTGPTTAIVAEARTRTGLDSGICAEGVLLYTVDSSVATGKGPVRVVDARPHSGGGPACGDREPDALAELGDAPFHVGNGHTFPSGVRIEVTGREDGRFRVRVTGG